MTSKGKRLERLVASVESALLPYGCEIETNKKIFDGNGRQKSEIDIIIKWKIRTSEFSWLIECRDRKKTAPVSWIEQLSGRKKLYGFDRVTAVSTSGFSDSAQEAAQKLDVELRTISQVDTESFSDWIMKSMILENFNFDLENANLKPQPNIDDNLRHELNALIQQKNTNQLHLRSVVQNSLCTVTDVYISSCLKIPEIKTKLREENSSFDASFSVNFPESDYFLVDVPSGAIRIQEIYFKGKISRYSSLVHAKAEEYKAHKDGETISQIATFNFQIDKKDLLLEVQKIKETGEIKMSLSGND